MKTNSILAVCLLATIVILNSCDPHTPPSISFKTGGDYVSKDTTVAPDATLKVGIVGKKREDDMKKLNISYAYDGATSTTTAASFSISGSGQTNYSKDYDIVVRNQTGVEKWTFVITDRDGNIAKLSLTVTVQNPI